MSHSIIKQRPAQQSQASGIAAHELTVQMAKTPTTGRHRDPSRSKFPGIGRSTAGNYPGTTITVTVGKPCVNLEFPYVSACGYFNRRPEVNGRPGRSVPQRIATIRQYRFGTLPGYGIVLPEPFCTVYWQPIDLRNGSNNLRPDTGCRAAVIFGNLQYATSHQLPAAIRPLPAHNDSSASIFQFAVVSSSAVSPGGDSSKDWYGRKILVARCGCSGTWSSLMPRRQWNNGPQQTMVTFLKLGFFKPAPSLYLQTLESPVARDTLSVADTTDERLAACSSSPERTTDIPHQLLANANATSHQFSGHRWGCHPSGELHQTCVTTQAVSSCQPNPGVGGRAILPAQCSRRG